MYGLDTEETKNKTPQGMFSISILKIEKDKHDNKEVMRLLSSTAQDGQKISMERALLPNSNIYNH